MNKILTPAQAQEFAEKELGNIILNYAVLFDKELEIPDYRKVIDPRKFVFVVNDGIFSPPKPGETKLLGNYMSDREKFLKMQNWETTEIPIGSHLFLRFMLRVRGDDDSRKPTDIVSGTTFTIPICPRRMILNEKYAEFVNALAETATDNGAGQVSSIDDQAYQAEDVMSFGGGEPDPISFMVLSESAANILGDFAEDVTKRNEMIEKHNPAMFVAISPFQWLPATLAVAERFGNTKLDIDRSSSICPFCRVLKSRIKKEEEK